MESAAFVAGTVAVILGAQKGGWMTRALPGVPKLGDVGSVFVGIAAVLGVCVLLTLPYFLITTPLVIVQGLVIQPAKPEEVRQMADEHNQKLLDAPAPPARSREPAPTRT